MKHLLITLGFLYSANFASAEFINYAIVSSDTTAADQSWVKVIDSLVDKHESSKVFYFSEGNPKYFAPNIRRK